MAIEDEERPAKKNVKPYQPGEDLAARSVEELAELIAFLKDEIARLEADMKRKAASRSAADRFFKR